VGWTKWSAEVRIKQKENQMSKPSINRMQCASGFFVDIDYGNKKVVWGNLQKNIGMFTWTDEHEAQEVANSLKCAAREQGLKMLLAPEEVWLLRSAAEAIEESIYAGVEGQNVHIVPNPLGRDS
jgi:hypothetical protein